MFSEKIYYGVKRVKEWFPLKKNVIVVEEGLILSPDFLYYMAQLLPVLENDDSILAISAWNPNGILILFNLVVDYWNAGIFLKYLYLFHLTDGNSYVV